MAAPKLLFLVTEDWYFVSHRLQLAVAAQAAGFEVVVATRAGQQADVIRNAGIRLIPFAMSRRGGNPFAEVIALWRLYRLENPDLVHHVALKPVMFGALAARLARVPAQVNAVAGLGWLFTSSSGVARVVRPFLRCTLARLLNRPHSLTIVQNPEDRSLLERSGLLGKRLRLIRGAGVDVQLYYPVAPAPEPVCIVLVSRMLWDKGVGEFVEAARRLTEAGGNARFVLVGGLIPPTLPRCLNRPCAVGMESMAWSGWASETISPLSYKQLTSPVYLRHMGRVYPSHCWRQPLVAYRL